MPTIQTNELIGPALDWAVAKCEGYFEIDMAVVRDGVVRVHYFDKWSPITDWSQGGPIVEREKITLEWTGEDWMAYIRHDEEFFAPTPLIAAMRCYVASKLGSAIEVPDFE